MFVFLLHGWKIPRVTRVIREVWTQASGDCKTIVSLLKLSQNAAKKLKFTHNNLQENPLHINLVWRSKKDRIYIHEMLAVNKDGWFSAEFLKISNKWRYFKMRKIRRFFLNLESKCTWLCDRNSSNRMKGIRWNSAQTFAISCSKKRSASSQSGAYCRSLSWFP